MVISLNKLVKEYEKDYGEIPSDFEGRLDYILKKGNLKHLKEPVFHYLTRINQIKWKNLHYTIYLLPKATPRPRAGKYGVFYVKGAKDNKKFFKEYIKGEEVPLIVTPCKFCCTSYLPIPSSMNITERIAAELGFVRPISKPDWDNLGKAYCDMLQDLLLYDDSLIVEGISRKFYSIKPRIEISISYMEEFDSSFNRNKMMKRGVKINGMQ